MRGEEERNSLGVITVAPQFALSLRGESARVDLATEFGETRPKSAGIVDTLSIACSIAGAEEESLLTAL